LIVVIKLGLDAVGFAAEGGMTAEPGAGEFLAPAAEGAAGVGGALCVFPGAASGLPVVFGGGVVIGPPTTLAPFKSGMGPS